jgi:prepilin-type processing-associated H-X9-DG protein
MADALDWWFNCWQCDKYAEYGEQWLGFETYGTAAIRHSKKANVAYWDGHVEQMTAEELKDDLNEWLTLANRKLPCQTRGPSLVFNSKLRYDNPTVKRIGLI